MKNRIIVLILALILLTLAFSSCNKEEAHTHNFSSDFSTDEVYHWNACQCGEKNGYDQHSWNSGVVTLKPTTESEGERTFTCSVCRYQKVEKIDKLTAEHTHIYDIIGSDENGHWNECLCGEKEALSEHSFDEGVITTYPTVDNEGEKTYTCSVCEYKKTEKIDKLDPDHSHAFTVQRNDEHSHWNECVCGSKENITSHNWDGGEVTTPATDSATGIKTYTCSDCGRKMTETIAAASNNGMSFMRSAHHKITGRLEKTPLTVEAEIKVPKNVNRPGVIFGNYFGIALEQIWQFEIFDGGVPRFHYVDESGNAREFTFNGIDVRTGEWMHIAFTFDYENGLASLYIDGNLAKSMACEYNIAPDATRYEFTFGGDNRSNNGLYFQGQIRSLSVYSDVRTEDEIKTSYNNGVNLYADDIILAYLLNKNCEGNEIIDLTGNGNNVPKEWLDSHETTIDYAYSFAVVGDTQWLSKYKPEKMEGIYDWIIDNVDDKKIAHVFGLGDITEDWNTADKEQEWIRAYQYISKLNGVVPYSLVRGNHDEAKYFIKYFDNDTYKSQFDGFMNGDITNSYMLVTIGSVDYLFMTLDYGASDEMLAWASEIIVANPDRRVIITTHGYMAFDETPLHAGNDTQDINSGNDVNTSVGNNIRDYNNGKAMWEEFVSKHPNIFLLLCGHTAFEDVILYQSEGNHGNVVNQICIDAQWMDPQKNGVGMVCMLYFSEDGTQMEVEWLSTDTGKYYKEQNQFVLDLTDSLGAPAHSFETAYTEKHHYKLCDCGYSYGETAHVFDGGIMNSDGFVTYTCECGYQRVASATDDPVAKELQALLEGYYHGGAYFKETLVNSNSTLIFYNGDKFWVSGSSETNSISGYVTLKDIILGKSGNLRLDMGWNYYDGIYSSANSDTVKGIASFVMTSDDSSATRVTVEAEGAHAIIKIYAADSLIAECKVGCYVTTSLVTHASETVDVMYNKVNADYMCEIYTPAISGYVSEYDKIILDSRHSSLEKTVYYTEITVWDGVSVSASLKGSGTEADPYLIENGADLAYIAVEVNKLAAKAMAFSGKYFKMTKSIDLNGHELFIGGNSLWDYRQIFGGYFDGNHCTIRGLNNTKSLFAAVEGGGVKNLSVYGQVNGAGTVAGIVGYIASGADLENLTSYVTVIGTNTLGGVVANAENQASEVINCTNYGNVTGSSWNIGGIAGSAGHNVTGCVNYGNIHSSGSDNVGGIAGTTKSTGSISNCYNYGKISSVHGRVGGIVGWLNKLIVDCINYGEINAGWDSGGVVGYVNEGQSATIKNCTNNGKVAGNTGIGGIFGFNHANAGTISIIGCVNNGEVTGTWGVGGIAGNTKAEISNCINSGYVSANGELGGIVGKCYGKVTECTNRGEVRGAQDIIGGIVGHLHNTTYLDVINSTNYQEGTVTGPNSKEIIGK